MDTNYFNHEYSKESKKVLREDMRVVGNKLMITTNDLDKELEVDLELIEKIIKEFKNKR